jgi:hypothetical protein
LAHRRELGGGRWAHGGGRGRWADHGPGGWRGQR